jgi:hypothetical protein
LDTGFLIQDSTLIETTEEIDLSFNLTPHDNGYVIIYTDYQYLVHSIENPFVVRMAYISSDGESFEPSSPPWNPNKYRILLYRFSVSGGEIQIEEEAFRIFNKLYTPFGVTNFTNFSAKIYDHAVNSGLYGYATDTKAGHVRIGSNLSILDGTVSIPTASEVTPGVMRSATKEEALALESRYLVMTPYTTRELIMNLKDIDIRITDPGITLGTALLLS